MKVKVNEQGGGAVVHPISDEEYQKLELEASIRKQRDSFLVLYVDKFNGPRWNALSEEKKLEWSNYRQALLDVPQQSGFPYTITWPTVPTK